MNNCTVHLNNGTTFILINMYCNLLGRWVLWKAYAEDANRALFLLQMEFLAILVSVLTSTWRCSTFAAKARDVHLTAEVNLSRFMCWLCLCICFA